LTADLAEICSLHIQTRGTAAASDSNHGRGPFPFPGFLLINNGSYLSINQSQNY